MSDHEVGRADRDRGSAASHAAAPSERRERTSVSEQGSAPSHALARVRELLDRGLEKAEAEISALAIDDFLRRTRAQLVASAKALGLTGIYRLTKSALAEQFQQALRRLAPTARTATTEPDTLADRARKFDLGQTAAGGPPVEHIPWAYGQDRVTVMVVAPERLHVYWEMTDDAIERARAALGVEGRDARLLLRVYDVSNRIFDGTNAHSYFDHGIARTDRQWFFTIGKPASTAIVELGVKSHDGRFVRIARSGRADFPRFEPSPCGDVEWLTVHTRTGSVGEPVQGASSAAVAPPPPFLPRNVDATRAWDIRRSLPGSEWTRWETRVGEQSLEEWTWSGIRWQGPVHSWSWESGPFSFPIEPPAYGEERWDGAVTAYAAAGRLHVIYGPWLVVIRGLDARAERRILGVWELHRSWDAQGGETTAASTWDERRLGASEGRAHGASERRWLSGSETRLGGASELYRIGASERRYGGASETLYAGASERRFRGASELWLRGASEARFRGASEVALGGGSETRLGGSEARLGAGSETRLGGEARSVRGAPDDSLGYPDEPEGAPSAKW